MAETTTQTRLNEEATRDRYEAGVHLVASLPEEKAADVADKISAAVESAGGVVTGREIPKPFQLAYTIVRRTGGKREKHDRSYYGWVRFTGEAHTPLGLREALMSMREVLRFLIVKLPREEKQEKRRSVLKKIVKDEGRTAEAAPAGTVSEEALDKEIDKLVGSQ